MSADKPIIRIKGLVKRYDGTQVVRRVSFDINAGQVLGLVGENGAGKSTLVGMLSGAVTPDEGSFAVMADELRGLSPQHARRLGILAVRQEPQLVPTLSVMENMLMGREPRQLGFLKRRQARVIAQGWLDKVDAHVSPHARVGDLSPADRQFVEIARVVGATPCVVFFDEPTAVLGPAETRRLFDVIHRLAADQVAVVYVSHRLEEVFEICQRVVVLRDGNLVADRAITELDQDTLVSLIAGRELAADELKREAPLAAYAPPILALKRAATGGRLHDITLELRPGETHGIFGIIGSGRSRLARLIAGIDRLESGQMFLAEKPYAPKSPRDAIDAGIILVPEDRHRSALFGEMTLATNVLIGNWRGVATAGFMSPGREARVARPLLERLDVRPPIPSRLGRTLSGGNQQKLILARALNRAPRVLILDEPTRGVDVGAKVEIHQFIRAQANTGMAVLAISSDLRELLSIADRITVLARGRLITTFEGKFDPERILAAATAGK